MLGRRLELPVHLLTCSGGSISILLDCVPGKALDYIMAYYGAIGVQFGAEAKFNFKKSSKLSRKLVSAKSRRWFLLKCRSNRIFPRHILQNFNCVYLNAGAGGSHFSDLFKIVSTFKRQLLNLEIKIAISRINSLQADMDTLVRWFNECIPDDVRISSLSGRSIFVIDFSQ